jgi:hypothetical protein
LRWAASIAANGSGCQRLLPNCGSYRDQERDRDPKLQS